MSHNVFTEQLLAEAYTQVTQSQPRDMQGNGVNPEVEEGLDFIPTQYEGTDETAKKVAEFGGETKVDISLDNDTRTHVRFGTPEGAAAFKKWAEQNGLQPCIIGRIVQFDWVKQDRQLEICPPSSVKPLKQLKKPLRDSANNATLGGQQQLGYVQHLTPESKGS